MNVDRYEFGKIVIDGKSFGSDTLILAGRVMGNWWRREGHSLATEDLQAVLKDRPALLIVGTGMYGMMKVPEKTVQFLRSQGIEIIALKTEKACRVFNEKQKLGGVAAAFHLTC
jgi:hypothetical protein